MLLIIVGFAKISIGRVNEFDKLIPKSSIFIFIFSHLNILLYISPEIELELDLYLFMDLAQTW